MVRLKVRVEVYRYRDHGEVQRRMADNDMESREGGYEARDLTMAAGFGAAIGIIVGAVVFAITQNPVWIGIGIPFGAALGIVFGRYLRRLDDNSPLVAIFGPFLIKGYPRDKG
jgi:NhaP-type Na+/H+ or K+/H+ antiporter